MTEGYSFYQYISELAEHFEESIDAISKKMAALSRKLFTASRMTVSITAPGRKDRAEKLTAFFVSEEDNPCDSPYMTVVPDCFQT